MKISEKVLQALWGDNHSIVNNLKQKFFESELPDWQKYCSDRQKDIIADYYFNGKSLNVMLNFYQFKTKNVARTTIENIVKKICRKHKKSYVAFNDGLQKVLIDFTLEGLSKDYPEWELAVTNKEKFIIQAMLGITEQGQPTSLPDIAESLNLSRQMIYWDYQKAVAKIKQYHQNPILFNVGALELILPIIRRNQSRLSIAKEIGISSLHYKKIESGELKKLTPQTICKLSQFAPLQEYLEKIKTPSEVY